MMRPMTLTAVAAWDIILPLALLFGPVASRGTRDAGEITWVFFVPMVACLCRGAAAMGKLRAAGHDRPSLFRRASLALALILLMFDEMGSRLAAAMQGAPPLYHWMPWAFYLAYLFLMWTALRHGAGDATDMPTLGRSNP
jgi:hypothetical protein